MYQKDRLTCGRIRHAPEKRIARRPCGLPRHEQQAISSLPATNYRTKLAFTSGLLRLVSEVTPPLHASRGLSPRYCSENSASGRSSTVSLRPYHKGLTLAFHLIVRLPTVYHIDAPTARKHARPTSNTRENRRDERRIHLRDGAVTTAMARRIATKVFVILMLAPTATSLFSTLASMMMPCSVKA